MSWRDGVHIVGTPLWCDARRAREVCFASRFEAVAAARHGQLIATAETLALYGAGAAGAVLSAPYGRPFTLGTVRLELVRSGAGLGAASLAIEAGGTRVLYAGRIGGGEGLGGARDVRACDALVLGVERGDEVRFAGRDAAAGWILDRWRATRAAGGALAVVVGGALDALELLAALAAEVGPALVAPRGLRAIAERARALPTAGAPVPALGGARGRIRPGDLVVWPTRRLAGLADVGRLALPAGSQRVAACATPELAAGKLALDGELAWSAEADGPTALAYLEETGARQVSLTGRAAPALAARLGDRVARLLGPPQQMTLF